MDLLCDPPWELCREIYGRYGLCMSASQNIETHLIGMLTIYQTASDKKPTQATFDEREAANKKLTLGNLIKGLSAFQHLSSYEDAVHAMKVDRDFLAHRFFRERSDDFITVHGCMVVLEELQCYLDRFERLADEIESIQTELTMQYKLHSHEHKAKSQKIYAEMLIAAKSKYKAP